MSFAETALLGALAGFTIYLGLPVGRLQLLSSRTRVGLAMFSVGILVFLLVDVLSHGFEIAEEAVTAYKDGNGSFGHAAALALLLIGGFAVGSAGLGILERRIRPERPVIRRSPVARPTSLAVEDHQALSAQAAPPRGARSADRADHRHRDRPAQLRRGPRDRRLCARRGDRARHRPDHRLRLHNATEGFGIIGPLGNVKPSWRWLALAGLIGGGPTFLGAMVGYNVTSEPLELVFYAVAGGAILYVIGEIWHGMRRYGHRELGLLLLASGFAAGVLTDLVVVYGGG